ncbi:MAG: hypothetical protein RPR40_05285 [Bermanella sp.]|jgi:Predicted 3''-5'' exonuclease related to the exonuclease domain of PolB.
MSRVFIDIETVPAQSGPNSFEAFLRREVEGFSAPSNLSKSVACFDLRLTQDEAKSLSKDDAIKLWVERLAEERAPAMAEEKWRKTSFDGASGEIISVAWAVEGGEIKSISRHLGQPEAALLADFFNALSLELGHKTPYFIGQYLAGFDLKFIFHRSVILGVKPLFDLPFNGRHKSDYFCTQAAWAGYGGRMSQDNMCKALGIEGKPGDIDGSQVWDFVRAGDVARVEEYNRDDVDKVRKIFNRLTFQCDSPGSAAE